MENRDLQQIFRSLGALEAGLQQMAQRANEALRQRELDVQEMRDREDKAQQSREANNLSLSRITSDVAELKSIVKGDGNQPGLVTRVEDSEKILNRIATSKKNLFLIGSGLAGFAVIMDTVLNWAKALVWHK